MKRLYRSQVDKKICGVCGGIAEYFGIDSTVVRLAVIAICILTAIGPALLGYIIAALVMPDYPKY